jgi:hypothetical protein
MATPSAADLAGGDVEPGRGGEAPGTDNAAALETPTLTAPRRRP